MAERLRDGDAVHAVVVFLELVGCQVCHDEGDDVADDGCEESPPDVAAGEVDHGADEGEVPVVPQVDVDSLGGLGEEHHDVHCQADRDDEGADRRVIGHRGCCGPSHVEDTQAQTIDFCYFFQRFSQAVGQQSCDDG